jgi:phosphatidate phosphatase APP1
LLLTGIKQKILIVFKLNYRPVIRVYNGYGNTEKIIAFGHVLKMSPMLRKTYRHNWVVNLFSMLRLFMVKPYKKARLSMQWNGELLYAHSEDDGFFKFEFNNKTSLNLGWHDIVVHLEEEEYRPENIEGKGEVHIPFNSKYVFVSDIDDTFLISHSSNLRRRLYVLLTKNARSRKPFDGVVHHYQLLASSSQKDNADNPFFYVSSSEWNLYDFIAEFSREQNLPKGVYLLNELKKFKDVWRTGQNKHATKFMRIVRIMEAYPQRKFILFGDDSQEDPNIYLALANYFADRIFAIYIRRIQAANYTQVQGTIDTMTTSGIHCCYFVHSEEAILHSTNIGLIHQQL